MCLSTVFREREPRQQPRQGPQSPPAESGDLSRGRRMPWSAGPRGGSRLLRAVWAPRGRAWRGRGQLPCSPPSGPTACCPPQGAVLSVGSGGLRAPPPPRCPCVPGLPGLDPHGCCDGAGPLLGPVGRPPLTPQEKGAGEALSAVTALSLARLVPKCNLEYLKELSECPSF